MENNFFAFIELEYLGICRESVELKRSKNHGTRDLYQKVNDFAYSYSEIQSIDR